MSRAHQLFTLQPGKVWIDGLVERPHQWEFSGFQQFVGEGFYGKDWGCRYGEQKTAVEFEGEGLVVDE